jgi:hypothetical protein
MILGGRVGIDNTWGWRGINLRDKPRMPLGGRVGIDNTWGWRRRVISYGISHERIEGDRAGKDI